MYSILGLEKRKFYLLKDLLIFCFVCICVYLCDFMCIKCVQVSAEAQSPATQGTHIKGNLG